MAVIAETPRKIDLYCALTKINDPCFLNDLEIFHDRTVRSLLSPLTLKDRSLAQILLRSSGIYLVGFHWPMIVQLLRIVYRLYQDRHFKINFKVDPDQIS